MSGRVEAHWDARSEPERRPAITLSLCGARLWRVRWMVFVSVIFYLTLESMIEPSALLIFDLYQPTILSLLITSRDTIVNRKFS